MAIDWVDHTHNIEEWVSPAKDLLVTGEVVGYSTRQSGNGTRLMIMRLLEPCSVVDGAKSTKSKKAFKSAKAGTCVAIDERRDLLPYFDGGYLGPIRIRFGDLIETKSGNTFWPVFVQLPKGVRPPAVKVQPNGSDEIPF